MYDPRDEDGRVNPRDVLDDQDLMEMAELLRAQGKMPKSSWFMGYDQ